MKSTGPAKLRELAQRIQRACEHPLDKPTYIHWSDAQLLLALAGDIEELENRNQRVRNALDQALTLAQENTPT